MTIAGDPRLEIVQILNLYGFAVDSKQWVLFDRIFTDNVEVWGSQGQHWSTRAFYKAEFARLHQHFLHMQHAMTNHLVQIEGERATACTYVSWRLIGSGGNDAPVVHEGSGWYEDELVLLQFGWRIGSRKARVHWRRQFVIATGDTFSLLEPSLRVAEAY